MHCYRYGRPWILAFGSLLASAVGLAQEPEVKLPEPPPGEVLFQIFEGIAAPDVEPTGEPVLQFTTPACALVDLPRKYSDKGLIADWQQPLLVRAVARILPPASREHRLSESAPYRILLRARDATRLSIDGKVVAQTAKMKTNANGHEHVPALAAAESEELRALPPGHQEQLATVVLDGKSHLIVLDAIVGSQKLRPEIGELTVALAAEEQAFQLASPISDLPLNDETWLAFAAAQRAMLAEFNRQQRAERGAGEAVYWKQRHEIARQVVAQRNPVAVPPPTDGMAATGSIDHFINAKLAAAQRNPAPLLEDWEFARRATLDIVGTIPTPAELEKLERDGTSERRENLVDRLLADARWADHWTSYWQDVLAENPSMLKGKLNNTGPFRTWIYESLLDNKPIDRFATETMAMDGSTWFGGPGGIAIATENDAPLAAKAHVVCKAFLAIEMKCARCHDAPYHNITQKDAFSIAAMLGRSSQKIPKTSVVPVVKGARKPEITISLAPGEQIVPQWPFTEIASPELPEAILRSAGDERERVAAIMTSPVSERFAQVMVNRLWARLMGRGIVEPVDDWEDARPSHPELLDWLARELVTHDYDMQHVARLILTSATYQRRVEGEAELETRKLFATPTRRRLSAEQVVDSLFLAAGKPFNAELLSMDPEGRRPVPEMLNLGVPTRAWQFTSLSNERDRPALALPVAQSIVDVLLTLGWRESRPDPITERVEEPTLLQPAVLANGTVGRRITTLSDDSSFTVLALNAKSPEDFVTSTFEQILTRSPTSGEREMFAELLREGFTDRVREQNAPASKPKSQRSAVSWSNHLSPEATKIKLELERAARAGDPPTERLFADWRERAEDVVWALVNTPEFMFVP